MRNAQGIALHLFNKEQISPLLISLLLLPSHLPPSDLVYDLITGVDGVFPQSLSPWCWL